jgi:hypothetical protein
MAEQVARCGEAMTVIDWATRLRCPECAVQAADFVITGARR